MHIEIINAKQSIDLKDNKKEKHGRVWSEEKKGRDYVIIISKIKKYYH